MAIFPTTIDLINSNLSVDTKNGTTADWIKNGRMNKGNILVTKSLLRPRPIYVQMLKRKRNKKFGKNYIKHTIEWM